MSLVSGVSMRNLLAAIACLVMLGAAVHAQKGKLELSKEEQELVGA